MNIQDLKKLNNEYVNSLLKKDKVDKALALEIIDLHLQPLPVIQQIYQRSLKDYEKNPTKNNDFLSSITEEILSYNYDNNIVQYPEPFSLVKNQIRTTALEIKFSNLNQEEFKEQLNILNHKKEDSEFINNHYRYNYAAGVYAYQKKFGELLDDNPANSYYRNEPKIENIKNYLEQYLNRYFVNTYNSKEINELLNNNEAEILANKDFKVFHEERLQQDDKKRHFSHDLKISRQAIEKTNEYIKYLNIENRAYKTALNSKLNIEKKLPIINKINNHTINKVISDMFENKEMSSSHIDMIISLYKGEQPVDEILSLYKKEALASNNATYFNYGVKIIEAIKNDPNTQSLEPDVNPFLIIERHNIENISQQNLSKKDICLYLGIDDVLPQNEKFIPIIENMIKEEIDNRNTNNIANIFVNHLGTEDVSKIIKSFDSYNIKKIENLTLEESKDIIKSYFSLDYEIRKLIRKYDKSSQEDKLLSKEDSTKYKNIVENFKSIQYDMSNTTENNMKKAISAFINNNSDNKVNNLLDSIKTIKDSNKIVEKTIALIDYISLEKDTSAKSNNNLFNRIKKKFSL